MPGAIVDLMSEIKFGVYKALNTRGLQNILAALAAIYATVRVRKVCRVSYDGVWVQRFPSGTLVEPRLTLFTMREIEESLRDLWMYQHLPAKGETVVDVGAGTGWETLFFSRQVGETGRIFSIEAHPKAFSCLSRMCRENQLDNVTLIHAAIMDREREVLMSDFDEYMGNRIVRADSGLPVMATTLDRILQSQRLSGVDLLKMNIEGAEKYALMGMRETLQKTRFVCISCHDFVANEGGPEEMRTKADVIAFLEENDFAVSVRESDPRPFIRDYVYAVNRKLTHPKKDVTYQRNTSRQDSVVRAAPLHR